MYKTILCAVLSTTAVTRTQEPAPDATTEFALDLLRALKAGDRNLCVSPYSIAAALSMVRQGADGETAAQIDRVLARASLDPSAYAALAAALVPPKVREPGDRDAPKVDAYELHVANALFGQQGFDFERPFLGTLADSFAAPLARIDFKNGERARRVINAWVETQTRDKIKDIVPPGLPTPDTVLALANAVYLKAPWSSPFAERSTEDGAFTTLGGKRVDVPFMLQAETFLYGETDAARLVELPYRSGELSMVVVLPKRTDGLPALERALDAGAFGAALAALKPARVRVALPKFSFTSGFDLSEVLPGMGMPDAFDRRRADFSGITTSERLFVGPVLHKVFVDVDEHGTEAAAATVVLMKRTSVAVGDPIDFTADHPFLFAVRHRPTGCILFLGRVANPLGQP